MLDQAPTIEQPSQASLPFLKIPPKDNDGRRILRPQLINRINFAHFQGESLSLRFRHRRFGRINTYQADPMPCTDPILSLSWNGDAPSLQEQQAFELDQLIIPSENSIIRVLPESVEFRENGLVLNLPEEGEELNQRRIDRHRCCHVEAAVLQNGYPFAGTLRDYSPDAFRLELKPQGNSSFRWLNPEEPMNVTFRRGDHLLYSGECRFQQDRGGEECREYVIAPLHQSIRRFQAKEFRGQRNAPAAPLYARFIHPLTEKMTELSVKDLSGSGFCLRQPGEKGTLMPGLILPRVELLLSGGTPLTCTAQVIYRRPEEEADICGLAIIDMSPEEHTQLLHFLHQLRDPHAFIGKELDMNTLWRFFFASGFLYPEKYQHLLERKQEIKELYKRLYLQTPGIARHFLYREGQEIRGHMAMLRTYENSWLLHHHAASMEKNNFAGLHVLNQAGSFTNNSHRIQSLHMDYLMCYFRKDNKFPKKVFGSIADKIGNPKACSTENLCYFHIPAPGGTLPPLSEDWTLSAAEKDDFADLQDFYDQRSQGLMLETFNLRGRRDSTTLFEEYRKAGLFRDIQYVALKNQGILSALIMVDRSEAGLNMADLSNCLKVFIIDDELSQEQLKTALTHIAGAFSENREIPVLLYPEAYAEKKGLDHKKTYTLWMLSMEATDKYFRYLKLLMRFASH